MPEQTPPQTLATDMDLRKKLEDSVLTEDTKQRFADLIEQMNDQEKYELLRLIKKGDQAREAGKKEQEHELARINEALKKHLAKVARQQETKTRQAFEDLDKEEEKEVMVELEQELNNL